ncbi:hypothetical protein KNP414_04671 [Paenibacillus mucilaginosus KNP414]|uniref:Uncharacterized protein n=1 Tax=Paenibacillus mucilaginosus (strain KNP414) TaxID=1036673 RepID=F8FE01_PAEMK|nr:hypothetical protein KNP414_04671 [Paenibacillus mucilaginosus KNP414]
MSESTGPTGDSAGVFFALPVSFFMRRHRKSKTHLLKTKGT